MICVHYFSRYREWLGRAEEQFDMVENLESLRRLILQKHPNALKMLEDPRLIVAVNQVVVQGGETLLKPGDEVAFFPPVTGG